MSDSRGLALPVHQDHRRTYADNVYVYPVISRRSKGVSIGINLNPDKLCNFDCVYCQVDRLTPGPTRDVDLVRLREELDSMLDLVQSGDLFKEERFQSAPASLWRLNDVAFSGDGEPTTCPVFVEAVQLASELKRARGLDDVKLVLITNASRFHHARVQEGLRILLANQGEIWAKLDAGTEEYYHLLERTSIPLSRILDNIIQVARQVPVVIQSMFLRYRGEPPSAAELQAYADRLNAVRAERGQIKLVQVYTVARPPAEADVEPLRRDEVDAIVHLIQERTGLLAEPFYGAA